jgi:uncharacterized protein YjiS (DUF1127 family)
MSTACTCGTLSAHHPAWVVPSTRKRAFADQAASLLTIPGRWISWNAKRRALGELAEASDYLLRDIGLTRAEILDESQKPFSWQR